MTLDCSPEFCLNALSIGSYRYLLETGHAPGDPQGGSSLVTEPHFEQI